MLLCRSNIIIGRSDGGSRYLHQFPFCFEVLRAIMSTKAIAKEYFYFKRNGWTMLTYTIRLKCRKGLLAPGHLHVI